MKPPFTVKGLRGVWYKIYLTVEDADGVTHVVEQVTSSTEGRDMLDLRVGDVIDTIPKGVDVSLQPGYHPGKPTEQQ